MYAIGRGEIENWRRWIQGYSMNRQGSKRHPSLFFRFVNKNLKKRTIAAREAEKFEITCSPICLQHATTYYGQEWETSSPHIPDVDKLIQYKLI